MKKIATHVLIASSIMISISLMMIFTTSEKFYSALSGFIGLTGLFVGLILWQSNSKNFLRAFGIYILIYLVCLILLDIRELIEELNHVLSYGQIRFAGRIILVILLTIVAVVDILKGGDLIKAKKSKLFALSAAFILIHTALAIPIYHMHGDFGGHVHGHSFWTTVHFH